MTFNSVYEITNNLSTVAGQHMVEYFTGNSLDSKRWAYNGEFDTDMADSVNGGLYILPPSSGNNAIVYMNDIRQFNYVNSGFITTIYGGYSGRTDINVGFTGGQEWSGIPTGSQSKCCFKQDTGAISLSGSVSNGSSETHTALSSSATMYGKFTTLKAEIETVSAGFSQDGIFGCTGTANLPDSKMQIGCEVRNIGGGSYAYWNYIEAWNN